MSSSWATLARRYPLFGNWSQPTIDTATQCPIPAPFAAATKFVVDFVKNSITGSSSNEGALDTSTTTSAPVRASARPSPVRVLTPLRGEAATASWPRSLSLCTTFDPRTPAPPITTIFMAVPFTDHATSALQNLNRGDNPAKPPTRQPDPSTPSRCPAMSSQEGTCCRYPGTTRQEANSRRG